MNVTRAKISLKWFQSISSTWNHTQTIQFYKVNDLQHKF